MKNTGQKILSVSFRASEDEIAALDKAARENGFSSRSLWLIHAGTKMGDYITALQRIADLERENGELRLQLQKTEEK